MKDNFAKCLKEVLKHEGGWADHPKDPGGATMKGITIGTYRQWKGRPVTKAELRAISDAEVAAIYRRNYWNKVRGDDLPSGLDLVAFDAAVNSGPARGARWLQTALGVAADGMIGPKTIAAAQSADPETVINLALDVRLSFLKGLKTWQTFGKGWTRRVQSVRVVAIDMVAKPHVKETPVSVTRPTPHVNAPSSNKGDPKALGRIIGAIVALAALTTEAGRDFLAWAASFWPF